jgi:proteasome lid subunit RPN8/RPN11
MARRMASRSKAGVSVTARPKAASFTDSNWRSSPGDNCARSREVFRLAIVTAASALIVMHNHPSGESTPSEPDIKVTRDLIRAGQLLKMELLDHVIIGHGNFSSLRSLGYFYA